MTAPLTIGTPPGSRRFRGLVGSPLVILLVTALAGFLLVGQIRGTSRLTQPLEAESEQDLARILASLTTEADALRDEISALRLQLLTLQTSSQRDDAAVQAAEDQLRSLQVLAGTVPVTGPGVEVVVRDPGGAVGYANMIDVVQELRDAGAEAVAVNGRRVGVASAFAERGGAITLDGTALAAPYRVTAIGQPETLEGGLSIPGGAADTLGSLRDVVVEVRRQPKLDLPALATPPSFRVARPVGSGD